MSITSQTFIQLEQNQKICDFKSPCGQMIWPMVRNWIVLELFKNNISEQNEQENNEIHIKEQSKLEKILKRAKSRFDIIKSLPKAFTKFNTKQALIFQHSEFDLTEINGKMYERGMDPLLYMYPNDSLVICNESYDAYPPYIPYSKRDYDALRKFLNFFADRLNIKKTKKVSYEMTKFIQSEAKKIWNMDVSEESLVNIENIILKRTQHSCIMYPWYKFLYKELNPQIVFYAVGMYGAFCESIRAANEGGIPTVEIQHGIIYKNHYVYNFHPDIIKNKEFAQSYPEWIFTHGDWFSENIAATSKCYTIGWPYVTTKKKILPTYTEEKNVIFLTPTGTAIEKFYQIAQQLALTLPQYKITIRPHPMDLHLAKKLSEQNTSTVEFDFSKDYYAMFPRTKALVGDMSTLLFTAIPFDITVFSLDDEVTQRWIADDNPFIKFKTVDELVQLIENDNKVYVNKLKDIIYPDNWEERYQSFLTMQIGESGIRKLKYNEKSFFTSV